MLNEILKGHRSVIIQRWMELIIDTYPAEGKKFLHREKDRFANPVGYAFTSGTELLFDSLISRQFSDRETEALEKMVRVRAVQDFSPSQAVIFMFLLKKATREVIAEQLSDPQLAVELLEYEVDIDRLALAAFDLFMQAREKLFDIRIKEIKDRSKMLHERMLRSDLSDPSEQLNDDNNVSSISKGGDGT